MMLSDIMLSLNSTMLLSIVVFCISLYAWWSRRSRDGLPPFPATPLPIVGNLLSLTTNPRRIFEKWRKQHGDVFSVYMGPNLFIVLNGFDTIKEAFKTYGDYFSDRPSLFMFEAMDAMNYGLVASSGAVWKEQRSVSIGILRQLGMGKNVLAEKIQEELGHFMKVLDNAKDAPIGLQNATFLAFSNIVCSIIVGERRQYDDPIFQLLMENIKFGGEQLKMTNPLHVFPKLMYIPGDLFKGKEVKRRLCQVVELFSEHYIKDNEADDSRENFITMYLKQRRLNEERGVATSLNNKNLSICLFDLIAAGTDTVSLTILWFILHLLHNPSVQEKIQMEIDTNIGNNRSPNLTDRPHLPYLNAAIMETQRISSIIPLSIPHCCSETVKFKGYTIPKGATVAPNLDSVFHDQDVWGIDADVFQPERHLDESGNVFTRPEFIPFSIGTRFCVGDTLAKMELFLFTSAMLQKFTFFPEDPNNLPTTEDIYGLTRNLHPFKVKIVER